jgi:hypothetical protein
MPVTINGTTGVVTPGATIGSINGILKSSSGVVSQASVGTDYSQLTLATAQTASGTAVDFTGIPSWVKRITVMFNGVSTSGSSPVQIQLGTSSGIDISGYNGASSWGGTGNTNFNSSGLIVNGLLFSTNFLSGINFISTIGSNIWTSSGTSAHSAATAPSFSAGSKTLSGTLDRLRITTANGTDTFDAGTINISYE